MMCLVCKAASVDEDDLTCPACRDYAADRRLHAGFELPEGWGKTAHHYVRTIQWLDAAAQRYGIPPPKNLEDATGVWAHFVIGVHAFNSGKWAHAATEAGHVAMGPEVPGFPGMKTCARIIRDAATQALATNGIALVRKFKVAVRAELPDLPAEADFTKPEWQHYQHAVEHVRRHDVKAAYRSITQGLKVYGFDSDAPVNWYLKQLGAAISKSRSPRGKYDLRHLPGSPDEVQAILEHYGVQVPPGSDLAEPVWAVLAQLHIAIDNRSWIAAYRRIEGPTNSNAGRSPPEH